MKLIEIFDFFADDFIYTYRHTLIQGILFLLFGILILLFPQILIFAISSFFIIIGLILILAATRIKRWKRQYEIFKDSFFDNI